MRQLKSIVNIFIVMFLAFYGAEIFLANNYIEGKGQFLFVFLYFIFDYANVISPFSSRETDAKVSTLYP